MDKDRRITGALKQAKGAVKDAAGKVTRDRDNFRPTARWTRPKRKIQKEVGKAKDAVRDAVKR